MRFNRSADLLRAGRCIHESLLSREEDGAQPQMNEQQKTCLRYGAPCEPPPEHLKLGIAANVRSGRMPINGLRHPPSGDTSGWYIWAGEEPSNLADFFQPLHIAHIDEWCPGLKKFLGLAPGWRFMTDLEGFEDVWEDPSLLVV